MRTGALSAERKYGLGGGKPSPAPLSPQEASSNVRSVESAVLVDDSTQRRKEKGEGKEKITPDAGLVSVLPDSIAPTSSSVIVSPSSVSPSSMSSSESSQPSATTILCVIKRYIVTISEMIKSFLSKLNTKIRDVFNKFLKIEKITTAKKVSVDKIRNIMENERMESTKVYVAARLEELLEATSLSNGNPKNDKLMLGTSGSYYDPSDQTPYEERRKKLEEERDEPLFALVQNRETGMWERSPEELEYMKQKEIATSGAPHDKSSKTKEEIEFSKKYKLACLAAEESMERARNAAREEAEANKKKWADEDAGREK